MMTSKDGILCWDKEPMWFLSPEWQQVVAKIPESATATVTARIHFTDGRYWDTYIVGDKLCVLPDPYTTRDIAAIRQLVTK